MSERFEASIFDYAKTIQKGEILLVEYTSNEPIHLIFYIILKYLRQNNIPFVIVDAVDQLHVFKTHLELGGIDTSVIEEAQVIKFGGIVATGKVLSKLDLEADIPIWRKHFMETLEKIDSYVVRVVVGAEKILGLYENDPLTLESLFGMIIRPFLGSKKTTGIVFLNKSLIGEKVIQEAREIASRVFDVELSEGAITLKIIKSINFDEYEKTITVKAQELQDYLGK
ncbi:DUF257 family protein [Thermococcus sp. LS2]|uniref:DUF257 family protein n=1 Tax=Thermococcus sp. LS2 TaxID=1638260 RepID=UPI0014389383|nr:DUF257 family protein [Thermococcus sp. LS2]NJE12001.1 hypothetical protein [Thermococcus sp. LS2]